MKNFLIIGYLVTIQLTVPQKSLAQSPGNQPATPVVTDTVKKTEVVPTIPITGNVYSQNDVQITASITGQLAFVAEPGTTVKEGDVIVQMNTDALKLQQAEQRALIKRAQSQLDYLQTNLQRQQDLVKAKSISTNAVEQTKSQRDVAVSDLEVAKLRLAQIDEQLQRSIIKAKFDGVVSNRQRREGETVAAGTVLAGVTDLNNLEIRALVPLKYTTYIKPGQSIEIFAFGVNQHAKVKSMVPGNNNRNQSYELRMSFENLNNLTIGQLVSVSVPMFQVRESLVVNQDALVLRENGTFVFKVTKDNTVQQIGVIAHENVGDMIAIDAELKPGDQVVIRGADNLRQGTVVDVKAAKG